MRHSLRIVFNLFLIVVCLPLVVASFNEISKFVGRKQVPVEVVGTGSMYPSLFWETTEGGPDNAAERVIAEFRTTPRMYRYFPGIRFLGRTYFKTKLSLGDMVAFQSETTRRILTDEGKDPNVGFIKRLVGLPGDRLELRDGFLLRNGELLAEPYLYRPRSTYGGEGLSDCQLLTIPSGKYFVAGDNRKVSADSRGELGLIREEDITYYLPLEEQGLYRSLWRDPSHDADLAGTPTLDVQEFYRLLNQVRQARQLPLYQPQPLLVKSAGFKAQAILNGHPDYPLESALSRAGYANTVSNEFSVRGRFTAEELLQNLLYFSSTAKEILNPNYTDIGVIDLNQAVEGCPTEVIVGHFAGYLPAEYDAATIENWRSLRDNLNSVLPSWEAAVEYDWIDQDKLSELLAIYRRRLALADEVLSVMNQRQWLSVAQKERIQADPQDAARAQQLAQELNQHD